VAAVTGASGQYVSGLQTSN